MNLKNFTPLVFLASLGAGGVAVAPFILMQYSVGPDSGLITQSQLWAGGLGGAAAAYYSLLELVMVLFTLLHFALTAWFGLMLFRWMKTPQFMELANDPLKNGALAAPLISLLMSMNLFIGPIRYFIPALSENFQSLFLPAMGFWALLFAVSMLAEIFLLGISFRKGFDVSKINFGWLLHPFLLGMLTVVGTGLAAMSQSQEIADTAAFMSMISGSMGVFLLLVKMVVLFKSHFEAKGLPQRSFLPGFLIVLPIITLFAISAYRFGHYLGRFHGFHSDAYFYAVIGGAFAFEIWYLLFGIFLLAEYFRMHHFKEFYVTQWGLVCPFVAFASLAAFAYSAVLQSPFIYALAALSIAASIIIYLELLVKHFNCSRNTQNGVVCES